LRIAPVVLKPQYTAAMAVVRNLRGPIVVSLALAPGLEPGILRQVRRQLTPDAYRNFYKERKP
jgi:hypothetical protein